MGKVKPKTVVGILLSVLGAIVNALPGGVLAIAASFREASIDVPPEMVRMLTITVLGVVASILLAPAIAGALNTLLRRRRYRRVEANRRQIEEDRRRQKARDIADYLTVFLDHYPNYRSWLAQLLENPVSLNSSSAHNLERVGVLRPIASIGVQNSALRVYRLTDAARPVVAEMVASTPPAGPPPTTAE
jgi:hypothetical protein